MKSAIITQSPTDVDGYARWLIRHKVRRLIGSHGIRRDDREDIEQDLALHAHLAAPKYDPTRGAITTFYDRVLGRKIASIVASRTAQKRDVRRECPLDDVATSSPSSSSSSSSASPSSSSSSNERLDRQLDVRDQLTRLTPELKPLADRFMLGDSETEASRALCWTRGEVRHRRFLIAKHLQSAGLAPARTGRRR